MENREVDVIKMALVGKTVRIEYSDPTFEKHTMVAEVLDIRQQVSSIGSDSYLVVDVQSKYSAKPNTFSLTTIKEIVGGSN